MFQTFSRFSKTYKNQFVNRCAIVSKPIQRNFSRLTQKNDVMETTILNVSKQQNTPPLLYPSIIIGAGAVVGLGGLLILSDDVIDESSKSDLNKKSSKSTIATSPMQSDKPLITFEISMKELQSFVGLVLMIGGGSVVYTTVSYGSSHLLNAISRINKILPSMLEQCKNELDELVMKGSNITTRLPIYARGFGLVFGMLLIGFTMYGVGNFLRLESIDNKFFSKVLEDEK